MTPTLADARALDATDPLAGFADRFAIGDDPVAYLDGNSLGRPPKATLQRLRALHEQEWAVGLIRGWSSGWAELPITVGDELGAAVLGAGPGQTVVADSTSVNLYKALNAACALRADRSEIVVSEADFPTDRYLVDAVAEQRGCAVRRLAAVPHGGHDVAGVAALLDASTSVVLLSAVDYRTGYLADVAAITRVVHDAGAVVVWDLSHAAGSVPLALDEHGVDLAVGCTYKYLNAGPGAPAFVYVAARHLPVLEQPVPGWFGAHDVFAMAERHVPAADARRMLSGTPPVAGLVAVREGVRLVAEAGIAAIRAKGVALTELAVALYDAHLARHGVTLESPRAGAQRGAHLTLGVPDAERVTAALIERGVIPDFRHPDLIRLGLSPLSTSYEEVWVAMDTLHGLVSGAVAMGQ